MQPIPGWLFFPGEALRLLRSNTIGDGDQRGGVGGQLTRYQPVNSSQPIPHVKVPQHPFMAANAGSNMHNDASMSDTYEAPGPLGVQTRVSSRSRGFGGYGTIAYDRAGRVVGVYGNGRSFRVELLDPYTLELLQSFDLPPRPYYWVLQGLWPWEYIGAGVYFYLDQQDRAVVPTTDNTIQVVQVPEPRSGAQLRLERTYDLAHDVVAMPWPKRDSVAWVLPDWRGDYYWYATTAGMVGTVDVASGAVHRLRLEGEVIENSFAIGPEGVFIISDFALYRFHHDDQGNVVTDWRTPYARGSRKKPGHITRGSGTSVTLTGGADGLVVITNNAEPRIELLFVSRADGRVLCSAPLFEEGQSGTDISAIAFEQADDQGRGAGTYSAVVENNWGHHWFPVAHPAAGLTRVDATRSADGSYHCETVWTSPEKNIGVFKLSLGSGLIYTYFRDERDDITQWYFTAVDFRTGATVYKLRTGAGQGYNNWAGALFLHPDGGIAYSTTIFGLVMVRDQPATAGQ
ncbi:MAG: hypothetical protein HY699_07005 [Deltaproteobacteria bacterium]|nr:hypothetical protein [Deltaproteobacteria bacterium]